MLRSIHNTVMDDRLADNSYGARLELLQAAWICQLQLEMLSCNRLLDVKKDLKGVTDLIEPWL